MEKYIGNKKVVAFLAWRHFGRDGNEHIIQEDPSLLPGEIKEEGYLVKYRELQPFWVPKEVVDENCFMELKDTIEMMNSPDYKERFKAEYYQTKIRYDKLHRMCIKYEAGTLDFMPTCSLELLKEKKAAMGNYLRCLEVRAEIEGVAL